MRIDLRHVAVIGHVKQCGFDQGPILTGKPLHHGGGLPQHVAQAGDHDFRQRLAVRRHGSGRETLNQLRPLSGVGIAENDVRKG